MTDYSVLMSVYAKEKPMNLKCAITSMLEQSIPPFDFVLVCDGPIPSELEEVIDGFIQKNEGLFQVIRIKENKGLGVALATGMRYCKCNMIARMDSDDIALANRMELQLSLFTKEPSLSVVGGQIQEFFDSLDAKGGKRIVPLTPDQIKKAAARRNPMNHVTVVFKKQDVEAAGGYIGLDRFEDYYLWARMLAKGFKLANIEEISVYVRVNNAMYQRRGGWRYFLQTVKLEKYLKTLKIATEQQYIRNVFVRFCGTVVTPNFARKYIYSILLRK